MPANDIFISYAWADNEPPIGAPQPEIDRWVWHFEIALTAALRSKLGTERKVWIDRREVRANQRVTQVLTDELQRSRLLLLLMSPSWVESDWCRAELDGYLAAHAGSALKEGVFVVEIEPVARDRWHERLRGLGAFPFHKSLGAKKGQAKLGHPLPDPRLDRDFYNEILALAKQIADELEPGGRLVSLPPPPPASAPPPSLLRAPPQPPSQPFTLSVSPGAVPAPALSGAPLPVAETTAATVDPPPREHVVWIAEPTDDLLRKRRDLRGAVEQAGYQVVLADLGAMLRQAGPVEAQLAHGLGRAGLYVHLLGPHAGRQIDDGRSWAQAQLDLARAVAGGEGWPHIAWRDVGTVPDPDEPAHGALLTGAIEQGFEELRSDVLRRLPVRRTAPPAAPVPGAPLSVCVTCSEEDEQLGNEVARMLDELNADYLQFVAGAGQHPATDRAEDLALAGSNGVVIVYGAADPCWMITKLQHTNQLRGRRDRVWGALVDAPVPGKAAAPRARAVERHDWSSGPRIDLMRLFIAQIQRPPGV